MLLASMIIILFPPSTSSFSWPASKIYHRSTKSAGRYSGALNYQMSDEWVLQTQNAPPLESEYVATAELELETPTSSSATSFEQELLDAYISHQSLLNSVSLSDQFIEQSALISVSDDAITTTITSSSPSIISDVWKARLLLLFSAALYGTNFTMSSR